MADIGTSFQPGQDRQAGQPPNPDQARQEAVRILSLRLPKVVGGSALAPAALLQGPGSAGNPFANSALGMTQQRMLSPTTPSGAIAGGPAAALGPQISGAPQGGISPSQQAMAMLAGLGGAPGAPHVTPGTVPGANIPSNVPVPQRTDVPQRTPPTGPYPQDFPSRPEGTLALPEPTSAPTPQASQPDWMTWLQQKYANQDVNGGLFQG